MGLEVRAYARWIDFTAPCEDMVDFFLWHLLKKPHLCLSDYVVETKKILTYASDSEKQKLDLHLPPGEGPFPVVIWVHGGKYTKGNKALRPNAKQFQLLERGYALASVDYRSSDDAKFPAQIQDLQAAVRCLRAHAGEHKLDARHIGAWGSSAGGHLVALLGTTCGKKVVSDETKDEIIWLEDPAAGNAGKASCVQAVVDWFGPVDFLKMQGQLEANHCHPENSDHPLPTSPDSPASQLLGAPIEDVPGKVKAANPAEHVTPDAPPFLIEHGKKDCTVPYQQSKLLRDALKAKGCEAELVLLRAGHGAKLPGDPFNSEENIKRVLDFFDKHLKKP
jgi:acetyl esterase/lipase